MVGKTLSHYKVPETIGQGGMGEVYRVEDTIGTLEPGKYADFAVLDRDFFAISIEEVLDREVVMTGLARKIYMIGWAQPLETEWFNSSG